MTKSALSRVIAKYQYPFILIGVLVFTAYRTKNAYFFSDDFIWFQDIDPKNIFEPYNGHLMYSLKIVYLFFYYVFGLSTYTPYLVASLLCMAIASCGVFRFLLKYNAGNFISTLTAILVLVVPFSDHTVFFLQAALQLLTFSCIFYVFTFNPRFKLLKMFGIIAWLAGTGGYGLPILLALTLYFIFEKNRTYYVSTFLTFLVLILIYSFVNQSSIEQPNMIGLLEFVANSYWLTLSNSFGLFLASIILFSKICFVVFVVIKRKLLTIKYEIVLLIGAFSFYAFIFTARLGVENILAARYIALSNLLVTVAVILILLKIAKSGGNSFFKLKLGFASLSLLLFAGLFHSSPGFYQTLGNIDWGSKITIGKISAIYCSQVDNRNAHIWHSDNAIRYLDYIKFLSAFKSEGTPLRSESELRKLGEPTISSYQNMLIDLKVPSNSGCFF
jgi:hypothetical protein